jgi:hypothetical protein
MYRRAQPALHRFPALSDLRYRHTLTGQDLHARILPAPSSTPKAILHRFADMYYAEQGQQ